MLEGRKRTIKRMAVGLGGLAVLVAAGAAGASSPVIQSVSPASAPNTGSVQLTISGRDFVTGASAQLVRAGGFPCPAQTSPSCSPINASTASVVSSTEIIATFDLTDAAPGDSAWDVKVTNIDAGTTPSCGGCFTVTGRTPTVTSASPSPEQGGTRTVTVRGSGFAKGAVVSVSGDGVTVGTTELKDANAVTVGLTIAPDATTSTRTLTVTNTDGRAAGCACLSILAGPRPALLNPASRGQGASNQTITVTGSGFQNGATVTIELPAGAAPGSVNGVTVAQTTFVSATELRATVSVSGTAPTVATPGPRDVKVTNPSGSVGTCRGCFTVNEPLVVTSTSPSARGQGATAQVIEITGDKFLCTGAGDFAGTIDFGAGITVTSKGCISSTKIQATVNVASNAATGARAVTVGNPDGGTPKACSPSCFTVNAGPVPSSPTPSNVARGSSSDVLVGGSGLQAGATMRFSGDGITVGATNPAPVTNLPTGSSTPQLSARITVDQAATLGGRDLIIVNPDGGTGLCACFSITNVAAAPTRVSPGAGGRGAQGLAVSISGSNFLSGATVAVNLPAGAAPGSVNGATVASTVFRSDAQIDVTVNLASDASAGGRNVVVTNPNGPTPTPSVSTCASCFTVNPAPSFAANSPPVSQPVVPAAFGQGATSENLTINGADFAFNAVVSFSGGGLTVNSTTANPTAITVNVTVARDAVAGARDVTVRNPDGGAATCVGCFTVNASPVVFSVSPSSLGQGASNRDITVTGDRFLSGATLAFSGDGLTVSNVTASSATTITAKLTLASGATAGGRTVTVTNPDKGASTSCACFTVNASPTLASAAPASRGQGADTAEITLSGTSFRDGATVAFALPSGSLPTDVNGITAGAATVASPTQIKVNVTVDRNAKAGSRDITVTNTDGAPAAACAGCFTVAAKPGVTSITPASRGQGARDQTVEINGSGFSSTAAAAFAGTGLTVTPTSVTSTKITVKVTVDGAAATGPRDVTVTNSDGGRNDSPSCPTFCFTVNAGPAVTSVGPANGGQQLTKDVAIDGTSFHVDATVAFGLPAGAAAGSVNGITLNSTTASPPAPAPPTRITANVTVSRDATPGARVITVTNPDDAGVGTAAFTVDSVSGRYTPLAPARILDTRPNGRLAAGEVRNVPVAGRGGVPSTGVSAVAVNVAVTETTGASYLTVYPAGPGRPGVSTINWEPGETKSILAVVKLGPDGSLDAYNNAGSVQMVFDVQGWYGIEPAGNGGRYQPLSPERLLDTRPSSALAAGEAREIQVGGVGSVPAAGVSAVVLNATVTEPAGAGYMTLYPAGAARPATANLNFERAQTIGNRVVVKLGTDGKIAVFNNEHGPAHLVLDLSGWITDDTLPTGAAGALVPLVPNRIVDSRTGTGGFSVKLGEGASRDIRVTGVGGIPSTGVGAVVLSLAVVNPTAGSYLTLHPAGTARPGAADVNFEPGQIRNNLVLAKVGQDGKITVYNNAGAVDFIFDVVGYTS